MSESVWVRLKQRALDERVTVREVVERAAHQYCTGERSGADVARSQRLSEMAGSMLAERRFAHEDHAPRDLTYEDDK